MCQRNVALFGNAKEMTSLKNVQQIGKWALLLNCAFRGIYSFKLQLIFFFLKYLVSLINGLFLKINFKRNMLLLFVLSWPGVLKLQQQKMKGMVYLYNINTLQ